MRAIVQDRYGAIDALEVREVERPSPADDEVLIRVRAASVHPDVWHVVTGQPCGAAPDGLRDQASQGPGARHRRGRGGGVGGQPR